MFLDLAVVIAELGVNTLFLHVGTECSAILHLHWINVENVLVILCNNRLNRYLLKTKVS